MTKYDVVLLELVSANPRLAREVHRERIECDDCDKWPKAAAVCKRYSKDNPSESLLAYTLEKAHES